MYSQFRKNSKVLGWAEFKNWGYSSLMINSRTLESIRPVGSETTRFHQWRWQGDTFLAHCFVRSLKCRAFFSVVFFSRSRIAFQKKKMEEKQNEKRHALIIQRRNKQRRSTCTVSVGCLVSGDLSKSARVLFAFLVSRSCELMRSFFLSWFFNTGKGL